MALNAHVLKRRWKELKIDTEFHPIAHDDFQNHVRKKSQPLERSAVDKRKQRQKASSAEGQAAEKSKQRRRAGSGEREAVRPHGYIAE